MSGFLKSKKFRANQSRNASTVYQAECDGIFSVVLVCPGAANYATRAEVYVGDIASPPPLTMMGAASVFCLDADTRTTIDSCHVPIQKGKYYRVIPYVSDGTYTLTAYWTPLQ